MTTPGEVTRAILRDLPPGAVVPEHIGPVVLKHVTAMYEEIDPQCLCEDSYSEHHEAGCIICGCMRFVLYAD